MASPDPLYLALLGTAESFRVSDPPNIKLCIQCLQGVLNCRPPPRIEARTHLQLGNVMLNFTKNTDVARLHLEKAWTLSYPEPSLDDVKFESVCILAELLMQQGEIDNAIALLQQGLEVAHLSSYWKCRILFQLSQFFINKNNLHNAAQLLGSGAEFCHSINSTHTQLLFMLSKGMVALLLQNPQETHNVLSVCAQLIENYVGSVENKEMLKAFFFTLRVTHYLSCGMTKSVKPLLRSLQDCIQVLTSQEDTALTFNPTGSANEVFQWMPKEHLCLLVYLVSVFHAVQAGYIDKAQKYSEKALTQIESLKTLDESPLLTSFQIMLLENVIMCHINTGNKTAAVQKISTLKFLCTQQPKLYRYHKSQLHTLLGLYAMSMNCMEQAVGQFRTAAAACTDNTLWTFINLNLGIVYARLNRQQEFLCLTEAIHPQSVPAESYSLKAAASYVHALQKYFQAEYADAKLFLQETLKLANAEDLNKLTACGLVLLGQIFMQSGKTHEVIDMVNPALQLAHKIPEVNVQLWGTALLRDLYRVFGDVNREAQQAQIHQAHTHSLLTDHCRAVEQPEHNLINWLGELNHNQVGNAEYQANLHQNGGPSSYM